jgi:hypothetical protein
MEGIKGCGGGGGRVNIGEDDSIDGMQCIDHPYRNNPGGICAFCLQEKLGKLVSSSFPLPIHASVSSSSSSPSFRSDIIAPSSSSTSTTRHCPSSSSINTISATTVVPSSSSSSLSLSVIPTKNENHYHHEYYSRKTRIPFLLAKRKKKKTSVSNSVSNSVSGSVSGSGSATSNIILKRSKSTATPRRGSNSLVDADDEYFSPRKRNGFWSFLYHSSKSSTSTKNLNSKSFRDGNNASTASKLKEKCCSGSSLGRKNDIVIVEEEDNSPNNNNNNNTGSSYGRKVSRSRSVGCGSRSFSGDFFERISTGFGDCTLRRVESQREGKSKVVSNSTGIASSVNHAQEHHHHCMKERVLRRCGGIFSGFMMTSSSSSNSSSNSSYWVSSNSADDAVNGGGKQGSVSISQNNRSGKSWGWAFASPMRAFSSKGSSSKENHHNKRDIIRDANDKINATPNLSAMPSLLAARG